MKRKKILILVTCLPNKSGLWLRANTILQFLSKREDMEVSLVHCISNKHAGEIKEKKEELKGPVLLGNRFSLLFKLHDYVKKEKFDLVISITHFAYLQSILCRLTTKVNFDMNGGLWEEYELYNPGKINISYPKHLLNYYFLKLVDWINLKTASKVQCVSNTMCDYISKRGVNKNKTFFFHGVDIDKFNIKNVDKKKVRALKKKDNLKKPIIGYLGNFQKWQGVENLIKAADNFKENFLVVGSDNKGVCGKNKNVILAGRVPFDEMREYYALCDVFVLPRPKHIATVIALPGKVTEYCAMGKPMIATDIGGDTPELIKKYKSGIIVKNNSPEELTKGIKRFLSLSEKTKKTMGINSRKIAENEWDWEKVIERANLGS
jgi:glycosyltransferase involved in cell wall biosynthesis